MDSPRVASDARIRIGVDERTISGCCFGRRKSAETTCWSQGAVQSGVKGVEEG